MTFAIRQLARKSLVAAVVSGALAAVAAALPAAAAPIDRHITVDGRDRDYIAYLPNGYRQAPPLAVVLAFHGGYERPEGFADVTKLQEAAQARNFVIVYPRGVDRLWHVTSNCCDGNGKQSNVDDVKFARLILDDLERVTPIDRRRVYATGYSNGASMSYHLACAASDAIAAIGPVSGAMRDPHDECRPSRAVSIFDWHGLMDQLSPYNGGANGKQTGFPVPPVPETIRFWTEVDGARQHTRSGLFNGVVDCDIYSGGRDGSEVHNCRLPGMGHRWPGSQESWRTELGDKFVARVFGDMGPFTPPIAFNDAMLEFFSRHPLR